MSGPKRELPPLHIKIIADPSSFLKAARDVIAAAKELSRQLGRENRKRTKAEKEEAKKSEEAQEKSNEKKLNQLKRYHKQELAEIRRHGRNKAAAAFRHIGHKAGLSGIRNAYRRGPRRIGYNRPAGYLDDIVDAEFRILPKQARIGYRSGGGGAGGGGGGGPFGPGEDGDRGGKRRKGYYEDLRRMRQLDKAYRREVQSTDKLNEKKHAQRLEETRQNLAHSKHVSDTIYKLRAWGDKVRKADADEQLKRGKAQLANIRKSFKQTFGGGDGGGAMGARADMFIHAGALQNIVSSATNFLRPYAEVENATIQMEAYTGSVEKAKQVVEELQNFAIKSPYQLAGTLDAANMLMKYNVSADRAIELTKLLGNVAAGDTEKLKSLAKATGQAMGLGRLQGQELIQLVNAGFNPIATAAREMAGPGADDKAIQKQMDLLQDAMRQRKLSADIIEAAVAVESAKGGRFAGLVDKQAQSITGWANQIIESFGKVQIAITEVFAEDLKAGLKEFMAYTSALIQWMKLNKQAVREWTLFGLKVLQVVVAFHAAAFAMAAFRWTMVAIGTVLAPIIFLFRTLIFVVSALNLAIALFGNEAVKAWIKVAAPVIIAKAAIIALGLALAALGVTIKAMGHKDGFSGVVYDWGVSLTNFTGFMWHFAENMKHIGEYIGTNWRRDVIDTMLNVGMLSTANDLAVATASLAGYGDEARQLVKEQTEGIYGVFGAEKRDTSMFNLDAPGVGMLKDIKAALDPLKPQDDPTIIKDKPNIDFKSFIRGGGDGGMSPAPDHAIRGSADHAVRMWQYGQAVQANAASPEKTHEKKTEDLLSKIERNTRSAPGGNVELADAGLSLAAPGGPLP